MLLHRPEVRHEHGGEGIRVRVAGEPRDVAQPLGVLGQLVRLLVADHLHAMLDAAQVDVGRLEIGGDVRLDPAALQQVGERGQRRPHAQVGLPSAGDELLRLDEEFDLADAAAAELQVVARDADAAEAPVGVDLALHGVNVGDGRKVEVLAPDERRQLLQEALARRNVTGARPRLDQRRAFPVLADRLVVVQRRLRRQRHLRRARVRPEPQIGAEHVAVARALLHQLDEVARQANQERLRLEPLADGDLLALVEDDEIDIGGVVQLECAVLAHGQHDVAGALLGRGRVGGVPVALFGGDAEQKTDGGLERGVRRLGQPPRHLHHRPDAGQIAQRDQQRRLGLEDTQVAHRLGQVRGPGHGRAHVADEFLEAALGRGVEQAQQAGWIALDQPLEVARAADGAGDEGVNLLAAEEFAEPGQRRILGGERGERGHLTFGRLRAVRHRPLGDATGQGSGQSVPHGRKPAGVDVVHARAHSSPPRARQTGAAAINANPIPCSPAMICRRPAWPQVVPIAQATCSRFDHTHFKPSPRKHMTFQPRLQLASSCPRECGSRTSVTEAKHELSRPQ